MMKSMKKLTALLTALVLVLSMAATVMAEEFVEEEYVEEEVFVEVEIVEEEPEEEIVEEEVIEEEPEDEIVEEEVVEDEIIEEEVTEEETEEEETEEVIIEDEETPLGLIDEVIPEEEEIIPEEELVERAVEIIISGEEFAEGETVYLNAILYGYEGFEPELTWQFSTDGENWEDAEGQNNELTYAFTANETTANYYWSVLVNL